MLVQYFKQPNINIFRHNKGIPYFSNMNDDRITRLKNVLIEIDRNKHSLELLEQLLKKEYQNEGGESAVFKMNSYNHNLKQTITKQLREYKECAVKNPKNGCANEYYYLIEAFKDDVTGELRNIEISANTPPGN
jgi:protoheme ferro-lyase